MPASSVPAHIFRAYDIRGHAATELANEVVYRIGYALGQWLCEQGQQAVNLGWDGRLSSPRIAALTHRALTDAGCRVQLIGLCHSGLLYFSSHCRVGLDADTVEDVTIEDVTSAVMVTASHNPSADNGFKIVFKQQPLSASQIQALYQRVLQQPASLSEKISSLSKELQVPLEPFDFASQAPLFDIYANQYRHQIVESISLPRSLKVVIDAGNGSAGPLAQSLLMALDIKLTCLYCDVDGQFPNHHPDPSKRQNLADLRHAVIAQQADLGFAFDGDGDRVVAIDHQGRVISSDQLLMLLIQDILPSYPGRTVIMDVKSSRHLASLIEELGGMPLQWKTGHSMIKQKMAETQAILGGEFSGHFYIADQWYGFDDGLYVAARLIQLLASGQQSLAERVACLPAEFSSDEIEIQTSEADKVNIIDQLLKDEPLLTGAALSTIDGIRLDYADGWGLIRASNTSAKLTLRVAADNQKIAEAIWQRLCQALLRVAPTLDQQLIQIRPFDHQLSDD